MIVSPTGRRTNRRVRCRHSQHHSHPPAALCESRMPYYQPSRAPLHAFPMRRCPPLRVRLDAVAHTAYRFPAAKAGEEERLRTQLIIGGLVARWSSLNKTPAHYVGLSDSTNACTTLKSADSPAFVGQFLTRSVPLGARFSPRAPPFKSNVVINELHLGRPWLEFGAAK